jgi:hypothetical protein
MKLIAEASSFDDPREPPLIMGNYVQLNSGGPTLLVVEEAGKDVVVAWRTASEIREGVFPRGSLHRVL